MCEVSGSFSGINGRVTFHRGVVVRACVAQMLEAKLRTSADFSIVRRRTLELRSSEKCDRVLKQDYHNATTTKQKSGVPI